MSELMLCKMEIRPAPSLRRVSARESKRLSNKLSGLWNPQVPGWKVGRALMGRLMPRLTMGRLVLGRSARHS